MKWKKNWIIRFISENTKSTFYQNGIPKKQKKSGLSDAIQCWLYPVSAVGCKLANIGGHIDGLIGQPLQSHAHFARNVGFVFSFYFYNGQINSRKLTCSLPSPLHTIMAMTTNMETITNNRVLLTWNSKILRLTFSRRFLIAASIEL